MKNYNVKIYAVVLMMVGYVVDVQSQQSEQTVAEIANHDKAVYIFKEDVANPFIEIGPDGYYYLTGTVPIDRSASNESFVKVWRSNDLATWESLGKIKHDQSSAFTKELRGFAGKRNILPDVQSPEAHYVGNRWVIVHTSNVRIANLMLSDTSDITGPYIEPLGLEIGFHVDPSMFIDDDGTPWLLSNCTQIRRIKKDFSGFDGNHRLIGPKNKQLGFEGTNMVKINGKYVLFGTSWGTDVVRKGTYNLYYTTADHILGPYSSRKFAGRFLGNGAPFKDKKGRWWALAFYNADHPPLTPKEVTRMDVSHSAYTINERGITLVPLNVFEENGELQIISKDPAYSNPGKEESQSFVLK